jgi:hypothetical protein
LWATLRFVLLRECLLFCERVDGSQASLQQAKEISRQEEHGLCGSVSADFHANDAMDVRYVDSSKSQSRISRRPSRNRRFEDIKEWREYLRYFRELLGPWWSHM